MNLEIIKNKKGQSMIMLAVTLGAIVMSALALSSFLNIVDLREVTDTRLSQAAIFAADTGIECALLIEFNNGATTNGHCPNSAPGLVNNFYIDNGGFTKLIGQANISKTVANNKKIYSSIGSDLNKKTSRILQITLTKQQ